MISALNEQTQGEDWCCGIGRRSPLYSSSRHPVRLIEPAIAKCSAVTVYGLERRFDVAGYHGRFAWYELITTDMTAAGAFYAGVVGWGVQDESRPELPYKVFCSGTTAVAGLMNLPEEATRMGATPRWMGYVSVDDVGTAADGLRRLGGKVYVPPTDTNIGRIAVVADPQSASLALVEGLGAGQQRPPEPNKPARVGWDSVLRT